MYLFYGYLYEYVVSMLYFNKVWINYMYLFYYYLFINVIWNVKNNDYVLFWEILILDIMVMGYNEK